MAIYKPSQHTPNLQEVDLTENNTFSCLVNTSGESVQAYKLSIFSGEGDDIIYSGPATDLLIPVANKKQLNIQNVNQSLHDAGKEFINGKDYQWSVRVYNAKKNSTAQPNTKVCEGYLVGSTKSVIWSQIPKTQEAVLDQLVYDRYIEITATSASDLVIGAHEPASKVKPNGSEYPYKERQKINWVTTELGVNEDYVKIETEEPFTYDYVDNKEYQIYLCSDKHTVTSAFADPNTNINVADSIVVYNGPTEAYNDLTSGGDPDTGTANALYPARKVVGYSSDTGEIRVHDAWAAAPTNGMVYRMFKQDVSTKKYTEVFSSDTAFNTANGVDTTYYGTVIVANSTTPVTYYTDIALSQVAGSLMINSSCDFVVANGGNGPASSIVKGDSIYYVHTPEGGTTTTKYAVTNVDGIRGNIIIDGTTYQVAFSSLQVNEQAMSAANLYNAQKIGGNPITNSTYFRTRTNYWNDEASVHRLFIQPNINIKSDATNPNELVFDNGVRINIVEQYWTNNGNKVDITFNKLDDTQWLLTDNILNESGKHVTDGIVVPAGKSVPVVSQTDYTIYTDFADSMPNNIIYARKSPNIILQFRNALRELKVGRLDTNVFYDENGEVVKASTLYLYYDIAANKYYIWDAISLIYTQIPTRLIMGRYNSFNNQFVDEDGNILPASIDFLYFDVVTNSYYRYNNSTYEITTNKDVVWVDIAPYIRQDGGGINTPIEITRDYREVVFRALWQDDDGNTVLDPQIKNYQYFLYAYAPNSSIPDLIKESEVYYSVDPIWTFRGLDGTATTYYNLLNPHVYKVGIKIIDEYDKEYYIDEDFNIFYDTENAPVSIEVNLLCDDQANEVIVSAPAYAQSTDYGDDETIEDITDEKAVIPTGKTLNYTKVSASDTPLSFPKSFTLLTKLELTKDFVDHKSNQDEATLFELAHDLGTFTNTIPVNSALYKNKMPKGKRYYSDASLSEASFVGTLQEDREYTFYNDTVVYLNKDGVDATIYYASLSDAFYNENNTAITSHDAQFTIGSYSSVVVLPSSIGNIEAETYKLFSKDIETSADTETFTYKVDVSGAYSIINNKIKVNSNAYHLKLYRGDSTTPENAFYVEGAYQDYINLLDVNATDAHPVEVTPLFAIQKTTDGYNARYSPVTTLPILSSANKNIKYVLTTSYSTYEPGVYIVATATGGALYWQQILDEEYVFIDDTGDINVNPAYTYDQLQVDIKNRINTSGSSGGIKWYEGEDNPGVEAQQYIWIDNGVNQAAFINHITQHSLTIFLRVEYPEGSDTPNIFSQVKLERKV